MTILDKLAFSAGEWKITAPTGVPTGGRTKLEEILQVAVQLLFIAGVILTLIYLIWGGINIITAGGDKQKMDSARRKLTYAIVGLIIMFLAFFIVSFIGQLFNVTLLKLPPGPPRGPIFGDPSA